MLSGRNLARRVKNKAVWNPPHLGGLHFHDIMSCLDLLGGFRLIFALKKSYLGNPKSQLNQLSGLASGHPTVLRGNSADEPVDSMMDKA